PRRSRGRSHRNWVHVSSPAIIPQTRRNWLQSASPRRELNRQNVEHVKHLPTEQHDRQQYHENRENFPEIQPRLVLLEATRAQAQNVQRGKAKHQRPENVVNLFATRQPQQEHCRQNSYGERPPKDPTETCPTMDMPYGKD